MITEKHTQEQLSKAFATLVAARAGMNLSVDREHDYGIDGTFRPVHIVKEKRVETGFPVDFQLKASINCEHQPNHVVYDCEADTYNSLSDRAAQGGVPSLLLVLSLPHDRAAWLTIDEEKLVLKRCCYWYHITDSQVNNRYSKRILIPRTQLFTVEALTGIAARVALGQQP